MERNDDDDSISNYSSYDHEIQSESTPILNITEILSNASSSDTDDDQSSQSSQTSSSMQQLIDRIVQGDSTTEYEYNSEIWL